MESDDTAMEDVGSRQPPVASLEQLKNLDSLSGLDAQLKVADGLCNHGHRAEMILKWLLTHIQKDDSARQYVEAWRLLAKCFRLVAPQRLGPLLARSDLLSTVQKALDSMAGPATSRDVLVAIEQSLSTLVEISQGLSGAFVKRVLCVSAEKASMLLGSWINKLCDCLKNATSLIEDNVRTAVCIWKFCTSGSSDRYAFSQHCLAPCARLLFHLRRPGSEANRKRKRSPESQSLQELELLIARHVFLPARTAFLRWSRDAKAKDDKDVIVIMTVPLARAVGQSDNGAQQLNCEAIPMLLDIALRCVPMTTSKQRSVELPWVESVFNTLLKCMDMEEDPGLRSLPALIEMLDVVRRRASLTKSALGEIVRLYGSFGDSAREKTNFTLIAKVIELDPMVFVEDGMASELFTALTATSGFYIKNARKTEDVKPMWQDAIIVPIVKAFASIRQLENFLQRWYSQLRQEEQAWTWKIWRDIDLPVADLLELNMTTERIESLFDSLCAGINDGTSVRSSSVVLHAILQGVRSDDLREGLQPRLATLFRDLLELFGNSAANKPISGDSPATVIVHTWRLIALVFQLWFPSWAAQASDTAEIAQRLNDILNSRMVKLAMDHVNFLPQKSSLPPSALTWFHDLSVVEHWLGYLCHVAAGYEACRGRATEILKQMFNTSMNAPPRAFPAFPELLVIVEKDIRRRILVTAVTSFCESEHTDPEASATSLVQWCASSSSTSLTEELVEVFVKIIADIATGDEPMLYQGHLNILLTAVPVTSWTRPQRERILNGLVDMVLSKRQDPHVNHAMTAMISLLELSAPTAKVCAEADTLFHIAAKCRPATKSNPSPDWDAPTLCLLEELTQLVLSQLFLTQEQQRSRSVLKDFYAMSKEAMESSKLKGDSTPLDRLVVAKVVLQSFQQSATPETLSIVSGNARLASTDAIEGLAKRCQKFAEGATEREDLQLSVMLDLLATLVQAKDSKNTAVINRLRKTAAAVLPRSESLKLSAVQAAKLPQADESIPDRIATNTALLRAGLSPRERLGVLQTIRKTLASASAHEQIAFVAGNTSRADKVSREDLSVLQQVLPSISKPTADETDNTILHSMLPNLLAILNQSPDFPTYSAVFPASLTLVRDKPFLVTQHTLESTLTTIEHLATFTGPASSLIYVDLTTLLSALLTHHRARLQNRLHLLLPVLQALQARLFSPNKTSATPRKPLTARHARAFTRLLTLLCNPPTHRSRKSIRASAGLVDESHRTRAYVGQFVPSLLHSFCSLQLSGTLGEGMREALTPALWAMIESMEVRGPDSVKYLSAAMNGSERAILRGVYEDWRRFGKWDGA